MAEYLLFFALESLSKMSDTVAVVHSVARILVQPHGRRQGRFNLLVETVLDLHSDVFVLIILT